MKKYAVYVDAAADISVDLQSRYGIHVFPIPVTMGDLTFQSGISRENDEFYEMLKNYDGIPLTSQITPFQFEEAFKAELEAGTDDVYVFLINARGAGSYGNATGTRDRFYEEHPEAKDKMRIHLFDGANYTGGYGFTVVLTAQKLEMGMPADEVVAFAEEQLRKQCIYFGLYTLKYAGKSGRIPGAAVFVGEALGIKPIMQSFDHAITTVGKARGEKKLVKEIAKMAKDDMEPNTPYCLVYGDDKEALKEMEEEMLHRVGYPPMFNFQVGPAIAINAGPTLVGVIFEASKRKREKEEKANKDK